MARGLSAKQKRIVLLGGAVVSGWAEDDLPSGQEKAVYYDKYGRSFLLPADPYSKLHYRRRGLRLSPPPVPDRLPEGDPADAFRQMADRTPERQLKLCEP